MPTSRSIGFSSWRIVSDAWRQEEATCNCCGNTYKLFLMTSLSAGKDDLLWGLCRKCPKITPMICTHEFLITY